MVGDSLRLQLRRQTDTQVLNGLTQMAVEDRKRKADFLIYLGEIDRRKIYAKEGYSSLFRFLTEKLLFSESSALKRIQGMRLVGKFPFLQKDIEQGLFSISSLSRLSGFVNGKNAQILFTECAGKSVRDVEAILMTYFPKEDVEEKMKKSKNRLGKDRFAMQFTVDGKFVEDVEKAKALLSHRYPQGRLADILGLALKSLIAELERKPRQAKASQAPAAAMSASTAYAEPVASSVPVAQQVGSAAPAQPEPQHSNLTRSRYIPRGIRLDIASRDNQRCQHVRPDGEICGETRFLEIDHVQPYALGGSNRPENLRLLCWAHNALRAEFQFGRKDFGRWAGRRGKSA